MTQYVDPKAIGRIAAMSGHLVWRASGEPFSLPQGEIAEHTMVTAGATSKRVDRLMIGGLVSRHPRADDGRGRVVTLTRRGRELAVG